MPRKWHFQAPFYGAWQGVGIRNDNPDKGTETRSATKFLLISNVIRNDNPDKGTETKQHLIRWYCRIRLEMITPIRGRKQEYEYAKKLGLTIRNDNPDKGTETIKRVKSLQDGINRLEMITPIRGRKRIISNYYPHTFI